SYFYSCLLFFIYFCTLTRPPPNSTLFPYTTLFRSNLDIDYAKSQMKQTRELFSKNDGIQAHHVIQSFKPDEVTPEKANQVGLELAKKLAPNHEVAVYTHDDTNHVHN